MKYLQAILILLALHQSILATDLGKGVNGWYNCATDEQAQLQDCARDTDSVLQCVQIPTQGLCSILDLEDNIQNLTLRFSISNATQLTILTDNNQIWSGRAESFTTYQVEMSPNNNTLNVKILSTDSTFLTGFKLLNTTIIENCIQMDSEGIKCKMCTDDYYQYYGNCVQASCVDQLLAENITINQYLDQNKMILDYTNIYNMTDTCSQYFVYLTQNFNDLKPIYYFQPTIQDNLLRLNLSLGNINDYPLQSIILDSQTYYQFYFVMSHTIMNRIQTTYLSEVRLSFATESQEISFEGQTMDPNNPTFLVFCEQQIVSLSQVQQNFTVQVIQQVLDPQYSNYQFQFLSVDLQLNNVSTPAELINQTQLNDQNGTAFNFQFQYAESGMMNLSLSLETKLLDPQSSRRLLQFSSHQIQYKAKTISAQLIDIQQGQTTQPIQIISQKLDSTQSSQSQQEQINSTNIISAATVDNGISQSDNTTQIMIINTTSKSNNQNLTSNINQTQSQNSFASGKQKAQKLREQDYPQTQDSDQEMNEHSYLPLIIISGVFLVLALSLFIWKRRIQKVQVTSSKVSPKLDTTKPVLSLNEDLGISSK